MSRHAIGLDFGTLSARALIVDIDSGDTATFECEYPNGIIESADDPAVARQDPDDYLLASKHLLSEAAKVTDNVVGIGIDATASTPIPVDENYEPLSRRMPTELSAQAWLWKDHSAHVEADEITELFRSEDPDRIAKVGAYYAEWFWAKILRCARQTPDVFRASHTWLEQGDFVACSLTGKLSRGICAAGHKALYHNGYPSPDLLGKMGISPMRDFGSTLSSSAIAGGLRPGFAVAPGTPVAVAGVDAHVGAVGTGVAEGRLCMVLGTSACHIAVAPYSAGIESIPGISGVANDSVIPGMLGIEAGQAAFGDLFDWAARQLGSTQDALSEEAKGVSAGSNGLLALDFHSGNRCPFADARLSGVVMGQTLKTTRGETYRSFVEATAFGIRQIIETLRGAGVNMVDLIACGGVAEKNDFVLQTIADVTGLKVHRSASSETCALGAAIFGAVAGGAFANVEAAQERLCKTNKSFVSEHAATRTYDALYPIWVDAQRTLALDTNLLKRLLEFRDATR